MSLQDSDKFSGKFKWCSSLSKLGNPNWGMYQCNIKTAPGHGRGYWLGFASKPVAPKAQGWQLYCVWSKEREVCMQERVQTPHFTVKTTTSGDIPKSFGNRHCMRVVCGLFVGQLKVLVCIWSFRCSQGLCQGAGALRATYIQDSSFCITYLGTGFPLAESCAASRRSSVSGTMCHAYSRYGRLNHWSNRAEFSLLWCILAPYFLVLRGLRLADILEGNKTGQSETLNLFLSCLLRFLSILLNFIYFIFNRGKKSLNFGWLLEETPAPTHMCSWDAIVVRRWYSPLSS